MRLLSLFLTSLLLLTLGACYKTDEKTKKFYGNVDVRTLSLAFRVSGRIQTINYDEGQNVKKGALIAELDNASYLAYLKQIQAQIAMQEAHIAKLEKGYRVEELEKAKAKLLQSEVEKKRLQKEFQRVQRLFETNAISTQDYDNTKAAYDSSKAAYLYAKKSVELLQNGYEKEDILSAKANLAALMAQRDLHKINLEDTKLFSPTDGTILTRAYEEGSIVGPSQNVVEIAKEDVYWVRSYVSEKDLDTIGVGTELLISTDFGKSYRGKVSFISPIAEFTPKTVQTEELRTDLVYRFRVILDQFDDAIKQGMPVTLSVVQKSTDK